MNAGRPPHCSCGGQDVGRVRPGVGAEVVAARAVRQLGEVLGQLVLGVAPGEVGVRLVKPSLARRCITFGRVNASARKIISGCRARARVRSPTPRTRRAWCAGCRRGRCVTPCAIQYRNTLGQRLPQRLPVRRSRSRTGRCPGTSSAGSRRTGRCRRGAGGTTRVLAHPRVVGRALEGDVERDFDAVLARALRPGGGSRRACRARAGSPCGRLRRRRSPTGCRRRRARRRSALLRPLRLHAADRMDRRQVQHVEAHRRDVGQPAPRSRRKCRARRARREAERGNNSYHAARSARARARPSTRQLGREGRRRRRSGWRAATAARRLVDAQRLQLGAQRAASRPRAAGRCAQACSSCASLPRRARAAPPRRSASAPVSARDADVVDVDAPRRTRGARTGSGSTQARHRVVPAAERVDVEAPRQRSLPSGFIARSRQPASPAGRQQQAAGARRRGRR